MGAGKSLTVHLLVALYQHKHWDLSRVDGISNFVAEEYKACSRFCFMVPSVDNKEELLKEGLHPGYAQQVLPDRLGLLRNTGLCSKLGLDEETVKGLAEKVGHWPPHIEPGPTRCPLAKRRTAVLMRSASATRRST